MKRLWVQLTLAFALVILLTVGTIALLADLTAGQAFRRYLSYGDSALHQSLAQRLGAFYKANGTWNGVGSMLKQLASAPGPMPRSMDPRPGGRLERQGTQLQLVLADPSGHVVYDSQGDRAGRRFTRDERAAARDVEVDGDVVGRFAISWPVRSSGFGPLEQAFVARLRGLLVAGALLAGGAGLVLGLAFSRSLTAPLERLVAAARAVAERDFGRRLAVAGSTEFAEVAQAFNEMAAALEKSELQRKNLVADVAHELRSPLAVIQGNLRAILDDVYALDKAEISRLYDETRLLSRLVDDLRELALADAGQLRLDLQPIDAVLVVETTVTSLAPAAEAQEVTLTLQAPEKPVMTHADPDRLAQILRNLLINALFHTRAGGSVSVTVLCTGNEAQVAVRDTGEGIAPEDLPHLFDRFWRADRARVRPRLATAGFPNPPAGSGSGLGLSVAQSLVEAHGGRIWAESEPGTGSTFYITLPLADR